MIFDEIPFVLKAHIFTYVTPNEWINTGKVSQEWLKLTLGSIKKVESCHALILDHLAEFINQQSDTNYTWVSLLMLMPRLEHLECFENTEAFWMEISSISHKLKILDFKPRNDASFDWNKLDISFNSLVELRWNGTNEGAGFPLKIFELSPKLEKFTVINVQVNADWQKMIPKNVKHILLDKVIFTDKRQCSINYLCQDTSALETFSTEECILPRGVSTKFFDKTPRLKKLELEFQLGDAATSAILKNAIRKCRSLKTVKAHGVVINGTWQRVFPENVKSIDFFQMQVQEDIRRDFSLDWLFQNYDCLQSLQLGFGSWTGFDPQKFYSTDKLRKLSFDNYMSHFVPEPDRTIDPFSDICVRVIRNSHLVDVEICDVNIDNYWRHIFPPTVKRLTLKEIHLSKEAQLVFSPQFICENPSNIERLILGKFYDDVPAMNLNAFTGMQMLQELHLKDLWLSGECLQSVLTHCSALTNLFIRALTAGVLGNIPQTLVLPSLRKLDVKEPVDQTSLLMQHFPNLRTVDIAIFPSESSFSDIMNALQVADTVELKIRHVSSDHLCSLVGSIDDNKFKYFCLSLVSVGDKEFSFYWTNLLLHACRKLNDIFMFENNDNVLWINNLPSSPLVRSNLKTIPSSMDDLSKRYQDIMANFYYD